MKEEHRRLEQRRHGFLCYLAAGIQQAREYHMKAVTFPATTSRLVPSLSVDGSSELPHIALG